MQADISEIEEFLKGLNLQQRKKIQKKIFSYLRKTKRERLAKQIQPDGSSFEPFKNPKTKGKMFKKLNKANFFKLRKTNTGIKAGFFGSTGRIARVHHFGKTEQLALGLATFPKRELLGVTNEDIENIQKIIIEGIEKKI